MDGTISLRGLGVAVATPFDGDGNVDYTAFGELLDFLASDAGPIAAGPATTAAEYRQRERGGCEFLVVLGSTGEAATIEPEERRAVIAFAVGHAHGKPVIIGTGSNSTAACVRLTEEAISLDADGVLVVTPYYNKPTPDGLVAHYSAVAKAANGRPVIVYNVPGRTGLNLAPSTLARLWNIPGIVAVKESSGNLAQIGEIARTLPEGKVLLSGDDALALQAIAVGASGLVSVVGNVAPRRTAAMLAAALAGRRAEAISIHKSLLPLMDALFHESNPIPVKMALSLAGLADPYLRLPLVTASPETRAALVSAMRPFLEVRS